MDRYQTRQMDQKDTRVNLVNEILNGIKVGNYWKGHIFLHSFVKVLKMYAWEQPFMEMIGDIRQDHSSL